MAPPGEPAKASSCYCTATVGAVSDWGAMISLGTFVYCVRGFLESEKKALEEQEESKKGLLTIDRPKAWNGRDYMRRDADNYLALLRLGEATGTAPCAVYQSYNLRVRDEAPLGVFRITAVQGRKVSRTAAYTTLGRFRENPYEFLRT